MHPEPATMSIAVTTENRNTCKHSICGWQLLSSAHALMTMHSIRTHINDFVSIIFYCNVVNCSIVYYFTLTDLINIAWH